MYWNDYRGSLLPRSNLITAMCQSPIEHNIWTNIILNVLVHKCRKLQLTFCNLITVAQPWGGGGCLCDWSNKSPPSPPSQLCCISLSWVNSYLLSQEGGDDNYYHNYFQNDTFPLCFNNNHLTEWWQRACGAEGRAIWNPIFLIRPVSGR